MRRALTIAIALGACDGVLHEKGSSVDATSLNVVTPPCDPIATPETDGHHFPGDDCLECHHQGGMDGAPPFTFAGTLFDSPGGSTMVAGATLHLIDDLGMDAVVVTQGNGNFYSTDLLTFPVVAFVSICPDVISMIAPVAETDGGCNRSGCHTSGFRVH